MIRNQLKKKYAGYGKSFKNLNSLKGQDIDFEALEYHFPGMNAEKLEATFTDLQ